MDKSASLRSPLLKMKKAVSKVNMDDISKLKLKMAEVVEDILAKDLDD
jgi:hypothetical protein